MEGVGDMRDMRSASSLPRPCASTLLASRFPRATLLLLLAVALVVGLDACAIDLSNAPGGPGITVPVHVVTGDSGATLILLPVTIDGKGPYTFAFDTGASTSLVDTSIAEKVGLPQVGTPLPISGVGGNQSAVPVKIQSWHTDQLRLPTVTAAAANLVAIRHESKLQGLVGSDVWRQFGSVDVNYSNQTITVPNQIAGQPGAAALASAPRISPSALVARFEDAV